MSPPIPDEAVLKNVLICLFLKYKSPAPGSGFLLTGLSNRRAHFSDRPHSDHVQIERDDLERLMAVNAQCFPWVATWLLQIYFDHNLFISFAM